MSEVVLFIIGFLVFAVAFVGSLSYAYLLAVRYDSRQLDREAVPASAKPSAASRRAR